MSQTEDIFVQPIQSIVVAPNEQASTYSKRLEREELESLRHLPIRPE